MDIIDINMANIDFEDICCAKSDKCASSKKEFLKERFNDGLKFKKIKTSGKTFIEYIPSEKAWSSIEEDGYYFINCFWVSGSEKGKGHGTALLNEVINDAKLNNKKGIIAISSNKKKPFLNDGTYLKKKGFLLVDSHSNGFELLYYPLDESIPSPPKCSTKTIQLKDKGFSLYYTNSCPYTEKYVKELSSLPIKIRKIETLEEAKKFPIPFTIYSIFYNGKFLTNEILTKSKFEKLIGEYT